MSESTRNEAFIALARTKDQEAIGRLVENLGDREFGANARGALIDMGEMAVDPLIENLKTDNQKIKDETALALIEIGDKRAIKPLVLAYQ